MRKRGSLIGLRLLVGAAACAALVVADAAPASMIYSQGWSIAHRRSQTTASCPPRNCLSLRGGGGGGGGSPSSGKNLLDGFRPLLSSLSKLASNELEPALRDPNQRILQPLWRHFTQSSNGAKALKRGAAPQNDQVAMSSSSILVLLSPKRMIRILLLAWLASKALDRMGFFEDPKVAYQRSAQMAHRYRDNPHLAWDEASDEWFRIRRHVRQWWRRETSRLGGILRRDAWFSDKEPDNRGVWQDLPPSSQFAVGTAMGWTLAPVALAVAMPTLRWGLTLYVVAECSKAVGLTGHRSVLQVLEDFVGRMEAQEEEDWPRVFWYKSKRVAQSMVRRFDEGLERVRRSVRGTIRDPTLATDTLSDPRNRQLVTGATVGSAVGLLL